MKPREFNFFDLLALFTILATVVFGCWGVSQVVGHTRDGAPFIMLMWVIFGIFGYTAFRTFLRWKSGEILGSLVDEAEEDKDRGDE